MKKLFILLFLMLVCNVVFGFNDSLLNKNKFYFGFNLTRLNLLNRFDQSNGNGISGEGVRIDNLKGFELEAFGKLKFKKKNYLKLSFFYSKSTDNCRSGYKDVGFGPHPSYYDVTIVSMEHSEIRNKLRLYLPIGREVPIGKHRIFFEGGIGYNFFLNTKIEEETIDVKLNKNNLTNEEIKSSLYYVYNKYSSNFNYPLFLRTSMGINFLISKKLLLGTSAFFELSNLSKESRYFYHSIKKANIYAYDTGSIYAGFSIGLALKK